MCILIVEDEVLVAHDLALMLEDAGEQSIDLAHNLKEAQRLVAAKSYDIGFLDWTLSRTETAAPVAEHLAKSGARVVLTTGQRVNGDRLERLGALHVPKPYSANQILHALHELKNAA
ncbi:MAG: response regulator [Pseudomonadota bacterium]